MPEIPIEFIPAVLVASVAGIAWLLARLNRTFNAESTLDEHFARLADDVIPGTAIEEDPR